MSYREEIFDWVVNHSGGNSRQRNKVVSEFVAWLLENAGEATQIMLQFQELRGELTPEDSRRAGELLNKALKKFKGRKNAPAALTLNPAFYAQFPRLVDRVNKAIVAVYGKSVLPLSLSWFRIASIEEIETREHNRIGALIEGSPLSSILGELIGADVRVNVLTGRELPTTTDGVTLATQGSVEILLRDGYAAGLIKHSGVIRLQTQINFAGFLAHEDIHANAPETSSEDEDLALVNCRSVLDQVKRQKPDVDLDAVEQRIRLLLRERGFEVTILGSSTRVILGDGVMLAGVGGNESNELITELLAKPVQTRLVREMISDSSFSGKETEETLERAERSNFSTSLTMRSPDFSARAVRDSARKSFGIESKEELLRAYKRGELPKRFLETGRAYYIP